MSLTFSRSHESLASALTAEGYRRARATPFLLSDDERDAWRRELQEWQRLRNIHTFFATEVMRPTGAYWQINGWLR